MGIKSHPPFDLPLHCRCGRVRGVASEVSPSAGFRFLCSCTDCQAFARLLGRPDVLDAAGGTDIFQMPAGRVTLAAGANALPQLPRQVLRWYAECCRTPIANTAASARFSVLASLRRCEGDAPSSRSHVFTPRVRRNTA